MKSLLFIVLLAGFSSGIAEAHARFKPGSATPPRNDSTGLKSSPCGMVGRTAAPKVYAPGQVIKAEWEETINHPGYFTLKFSKANDTGFDDYVLAAKIVDTQNSPVPNPAGYHQYTASITLPNVTCEACTIQLVQVMEEDPANPRYYYSCSDVKLVDSPSPTSPTTPPVATPPPSPPTSDSSGSTPSPGELPASNVKPAKPKSLKVEKQN